MKGPRRERYSAGPYDIHVLGIPRPGLRDLYHAMLRVPWWAAIATIVAGYLGLNVIFALLYVVGGGVANARAGSFADAFYFSVQTMGTIGYGAMSPESTFAHVVVVIESVTGLLVVALTSGLVFARFSQTRARVVFSARAVIGPVDGVPTLMVRIGNERRGQIVDAHFRMSVTRTVVTREGVTHYRTEDLALVRERAQALARSWTVQHRIGPDSPFASATPESMEREEAELTLTIVGTDDTSMQTVFARHVWFPRDIAWGARLADVLTELPNGDMTLDLRRFHDAEPTDPVDGFPYPGR